MHAFTHSHCAYVFGVGRLFYVRIFFPGPVLPGVSRRDLLIFCCCLSFVCTRRVHFTQLRVGEIARSHAIDAIFADAEKMDVFSE